MLRLRPGLRGRRAEPWPGPVTRADWSNVRIDAMPACLPACLPMYVPRYVPPSLVCHMPACSAMAREDAVPQYAADAHIYVWVGGAVADAGRHKNDTLWLRHEHDGRGGQHGLTVTGGACGAMAICMYAIKPCAFRRHDACIWSCW